MKHLTPPVDFSSGSGLARLVPREVLRLDMEQRARHLEYRSDAPKVEAAERSREEMSHLLHSVTMAYQACGFEELARSSRQMRKLAVQSGLPDMARAADNVLDCIDQCDSAALGATVARLHRLGLLALRELGL